MDSYVVVGTVLAVLASAVLFMRPAKKTDTRMTNDMLKIGEQMKMYKQSAAAAAAATASASASMERRTSSVDASAFPGGRVTILFGSQTGTAEGFAEVLKKEGRKHGFEAHAMDLEEYKAEEALPQEKCVILVMATYGEGDPTDNAVEFIKLLKGKHATAAPLTPQSLTGVSFTVFGLGNRQYEQYNAVGRFVDDAMAQYGAERVFHYGEGDDDGSLDEDFDNWKETLWRELRLRFVADAAQDEKAALNGGSSSTVGAGAGAAPELEYECVEIRRPANGVAPSMTVRMKPSTKHFFTAASAKIVVNRELRPSTRNGSTIHVEMDLRGTGVEYLTADNLAILPVNSESVTTRLAAQLGYDLEQWVSLVPVGDDTHGELPFPSPCSIETILSRYLAINAAPRKGPLKQLAYFARDEHEKARLLFLASKEGKEEYQTWVLDDERSYVDVLEQFRSVRIPLAALIQLVPFMTPRYYTISSSSLVNPQRVHATVSIITNKKSDGREFNGVCTTYLAGLEPLSGHTDQAAKKKRDSRPGEQGVKKPREWPTARIFVRASTFRLPKDPLTPIILIGPGTGIAPMRAFLQERAELHKQGVSIGPSVLYFGCRQRDEDYIYRDELEAFQASGVLTQLHLAFSREQVEKVYVQHLLQQQGANVWQLIHEQGAYVYVCGATTMGNDVHKVLHEITETHGHQTSEQAAATLKAMQDSHRYVQELWA